MQALVAGVRVHEALHEVRDGDEDRGGAAGDLPAAPDLRVPGRDLRPSSRQSRAHCQAWDNILTINIYLLSTITKLSISHFVSSVRNLKQYF